MQHFVTLQSSSLPLNPSPYDISRWILHGPRPSFNFTLYYCFSSMFMAPGVFLSSFQAESCVKLFKKYFIRNFLYGKREAINASSVRCVCSCSSSAFQFCLEFLLTKIKIPTFIFINSFPLYFIFIYYILFSNLLDWTLIFLSLFCTNFVKALKSFDFSMRNFLRRGIFLEYNFLSFHL